MTRANEHSQQCCNLKYDEYKDVKEKRLDATSKKSVFMKNNSDIPRIYEGWLNEVIYFLRYA